MWIRSRALALFLFVCALAQSAQAEATLDGRRRVYFYYMSTTVIMMVGFLPIPVPDNPEIEIFANGQRIGVLNSGEFISMQVFPGQYTLKLKHSAVFSGESEHKINVPDADIYVGCITGGSDAHTIYGSTTPPKGFSELKRP